MIPQEMALEQGEEEEEELEEPAATEELEEEEDDERDFHLAPGFGVGGVHDGPSDFDLDWLAHVELPSGFEFAASAVRVDVDASESRAASVTGTAVEAPCGGVVNGGCAGAVHASAQLQAAAVPSEDWSWEQCEEGDVPGVDVGELTPELEAFFSLVPSLCTAE